MQQIELARPAVQPHGVTRSGSRTAVSRGFTLVELTAIIVILGFMTAVLIPRYLTYVRETRISALNSLAGAVRMSVQTVRLRYMFLNTGTSPITMRDGSTVAVATAPAARRGLPLSSGGGIGNALRISGFAYAAGGATGTFDFVPAVTNCRLTYTAATGAVTLTTAGC
jgi:MSHA pilin protein MshA